MTYFCIHFTFLWNCVGVSSDMFAADVHHRLFKWQGMYCMLLKCTLQYYFEWSCVWLFNKLSGIKMLSFFGYTHFGLKMVFVIILLLFRDWFIWDKSKSFIFLNNWEARISHFLVGFYICMAWKKRDFDMCLAAGHYKGRSVGNKLQSYSSYSSHVVHWHHKERCKTPLDSNSLI